MERFDRLSGCVQPTGCYRRTTFSKAFVRIGEGGGGNGGNAIKRKHDSFDNNNKGRMQRNDVAYRDTRIWFSSVRSGE